MFDGVPLARVLLPSLLLVVLFDAAIALAANALVCRGVACCWIVCRGAGDGVLLLDAWLCLFRQLSYRERLSRAGGRLGLWWRRLSLR